LKIITLAQFIYQKSKAGGEGFFGKKTGYIAPFSANIGTGIGGDKK